jgi:uncharacterized membrane protein YphA (DoxX/SURF4 family)
MKVAVITNYVNSLPRLGLGIVFLLFGVDKFAFHERLVSWFMVTDRARTLLPTQDIGMFVYLLGAVELIVAALLLSGVIVRATSIAATAMMVTIIAAAQYPSSFPQDIGLIGISIMLVLTSAGWRSRIELTRFPLLVRYSISAVLLIWAGDHLLNTSTHVSWLQLFNTTVRALPSEFTYVMIISIAIVEIAIGGILASGKLGRYITIAACAFFILAYILLAPPLNNYQSIGLAIASAWLVYVSKQKRGTNM